MFSIISQHGARSGGGRAEATERSVRVRRAGAICIFSQYSSRSSAVSSVDRNAPSLVPPFPCKLPSFSSTLPLYFPLILVAAAAACLFRAKHRFHVVSTRSGVPVAGFDCNATPIDDPALRFARYSTVPWIICIRYPIRYAEKDFRQIYIYIRYRTPRRFHASLSA